MSGLHQVSTIAKILNIEATAKEFKSLSLYTMLRQFQRHTGIEQLSHLVFVALSFNKGRVSLGGGGFGYVIPSVSYAGENIEPFAEP